MHEREQLIYAIPEKSTSMSLGGTYKVPVPRNFTHGGENFSRPTNTIDYDNVEKKRPSSAKGNPLS